MAQKNIIQFFGGNRSTKHPILDDVSEILNPCKKQKIDKKKKIKRKFRDECINEKEWLIDDEEQGVMFCKWCKEANKKNLFGSSGSSNFQKSAHYLG